MENQLKEKTVFITGAGGVLGSTYIRRMLMSGATILASDLAGHRANALLEEHGDDEAFRFFELDVADEKGIVDLFDQFKTRQLNPNVFLNNAAITGEMLVGEGGTIPDFANTSVDDWERTLKTNLTGAFMIARQIERDFIGQYPCKLINVASMYALNGPHHKIYDGLPFSSFSAYSATKAGIHGLTLWLAGYWAGRDATVNTIAPGAVYNGHSEVFQQRVSELIMAGRMAEPDEIADVMLFLCSTQSDYMTGQMVNVDGGFSGW